MNRDIIVGILKSWAQSHTLDWTIADTDLNKTAENMTNAVRAGYFDLNLDVLAAQIEFLMSKTPVKSPSEGMFCKQCKDFCVFAESNQEDGSFVCYLCRQDPYR
jgi:hypothetical protein